MRRLARHLFTLCSAVSLVLCVAVCVLWVLTYNSERKWILAERRPESALGHGDFSEYLWEITSARGQLYERRMHVHRYWGGNTPPVPGWWPRNKLPPTRTTLTNRLGFGIDYRWQIRTPYPGAVVTGWRDVWVPHWAVALATGLVPCCTILGAIRRSRRRRHGACIACGYDLRASPERCPECGEVGAASAAVRDPGG